MARQHKTNILNIVNQAIQPQDHWSCGFLMVCMQVMDYLIKKGHSTQTQNQ
jgi:hypothetical protein